ncbi:ABC transporter permease [Mahella sp.]|uniref:ABC transporter permease n=1 Tax=Mahella sp. TaxID=2798721 RepID=UPI0034188C5F
MALGALVALYIFFALFGNNFFSYDAFVNILDSSYYIGFMAIGVTFVIITGGIDLSLGTVLICSALIGGVAHNNWGLSMGLSLLIGVIVGTLFGFLNGVLVARFKLPPFVATLGSMMIAQGMGAIVSKVVTIRYPDVTSPEGWFKHVFYKTDNGFPIGIIWLLLAAIIAHIILTKTKVGRYIFAVGSNEEATRLSGVNVIKWKTIAYIISGLFSGIGGIMYAAAYTSIVPATGNGFELLAIAAAVIGGTSLSGGIGSITGTLIGVYIMSVLKQGLMSMNLQAHYQTLFTGIVVIAAVLFDIYRNKRATEVSDSK